MQNASERPDSFEADPRLPVLSGWNGERPSTLICLTCGASLESMGAPRIRCSECGTLGYPDRSGRNLVAVSWGCTACGTRNNGTTNFCIECGAGLPSRCLKCEYPVYTSVCQRCGSHQDALVRLRSIEADRAEWVPLQQSYLEAERRKLEQQRAKQAAREETARGKEHNQSILLEAETAPESSVGDADWQSMWPRVNQGMRLAARQRSQRLAHQRGRILQRMQHAFGGKRMGLAWICIGLTLVLLQFRTQFSALVITAAASPLGTTILSAFASWWLTANAVLTSAQSIDKSSPQYAVFFAVTLFSIAALPVVIYVALRIMRWLAS